MLVLIDSDSFAEQAQQAESGRGLAVPRVLAPRQEHMPEGYSKLLEAIQPRNKFPDRPTAGVLSVLESVNQPSLIPAHVQAKVQYSVCQCPSVAQVVGICGQERRSRRVAISRLQGGGREEWQTQRRIWLAVGCDLLLAAYRS